MIQKSRSIVSLSVSDAHIKAITIFGFDTEEPVHPHLHFFERHLPVIDTLRLMQRVEQLDQIDLVRRPTHFRNRRGLPQITMRKEQVQFRVDQLCQHHAKLRQPLIGDLLPPEH
nr:hypothetical protein [uncultured Prevotella sp.]